LIILILILFVEDHVDIQAVWCLISNRLKKLSAILFSVLLVCMQTTPLSAVALTSPCCQKVTTDTCAASCGDADCCVAHPSPDSKPAPTVPAQFNAQNQVSLLAPMIMAWALPENPANAISSITVLPLMATSVPLYERNCALLL